jgi:hypothetical protein
MGYMGFGMRKEVYARKPKKRFVLWRSRLRGENAAPEDVELRKDRPARTMQEIQQQHRWRLADYLPTFSIATVVSATLALAVAAIVLYVGVKLVIAVLTVRHMVP